MTTPEARGQAGETGLLGKAALVVSILSMGWLLEQLLLMTVLLSLVVMILGLSAGEAGGAVAGVLAVTGVAAAVFGPLLRPWHPLSTWLTMLTTLAFDIGVILVLGPR